MSLEIKITVPDDAVAGGKADRYVSTALAAIGYARSLQGVTELRVEPGADWATHVGKPGMLELSTGEAASPQTGAVEDDGADAAPEPSTGAPAQLRLHGKAGDGRTRRTKAEMAEDEAMEAAVRAAGRDIAQVDELLTAGHSRETIMAELSVLATGNGASTTDKPQISTGENRVGPDDPSDSDAAQDAADEVAEAARNRDADAGPTHADLTAAVGRYQKAYSMEAAIADTPIILGKAIADVPKDDLPAAIAAIEAAIANGRPGSAAPAATPTQPATKAQVGAALMEYARKFDGADIDPADVSTYPHTHQDGGKVFAMLFGDGVTKLSQVPDAGDGIAFGRALAGIREMTEKNPFGREAK